MNNYLTENIRKRAMRRSLIRVCASALMFVAFLLVYFATTFGWFSQNKEVSATGMGVLADGFEITVQYYCKATPDGEYTPVDSWEGEAMKEFLDLLPGESVYIKAEYTNNEEETYTGNTFFVPVEEVPYVEDDKYYYFGSQLYISSLKVGNTEKKFEKNIAEKYLVPYTLGYPGATAPVLCFDTNTIEVGNTSICDSFEVPAKTGDTPGTATIEFVLTFNNLSENQNNYKFKNFTDGGGKCIRYIYTDFIKVEN